MCLRIVYIGKTIGGPLQLTHNGLSEREFDLSYHGTVHTRYQKRASILFWKRPSSGSWKSLGSVLASTMASSNAGLHNLIS